MNKFLKISLIAIFILKLSHTATSQTKVDTSKVYNLHEVNVVRDKVQNEIIPVQVLSGKKLKSLNAHSVADAIRYFSGIQIKDYGGIGGLKTVNVRSMGSHHVGVFYDGIQIGNAQNGIVDLGRFSLDNMEAISIYNGQKSALFQPAKNYASASALFLRTKTPIFKDSKTNHLNVGFKTGSFDLYNPSVLWEHKLNDKISCSFNTEYMYTSGKYKFTYAKKDGYKTTETRKNGDVKMIRVEGSLFGKIKSGNWKTKLYLYDSERGYPGASVREEPGKFRHQDRQWDNNFFIQGSFKKKLTTNYSLLLNAKYAYDYMHYLSDPRLDVSTMYVNNHYKQQEAYFSAAQLYSVNDLWSVSLASDIQYNTLDADLINFVYPERYTYLNALASSICFTRLKVQGSLLHTRVINSTKVEGGKAKNMSEFTPTLVFSYQPFSENNFHIRAFYKRVFRLPTFNDLYYTFIGNKNLNPEFTTQYNIGATYHKLFESGLIKSIKLKVDAYYNEVEDKIIAMPTSNQFRWTMINLGEVEIRGIDASISTMFKFRDVSINTLLNYTYQKAQDFTDRSSEWYGGQIPYIPWHSGSVVSNISHKGWGLNYSFIYTGERYEAVANIKENYAQPWYTHDLSISKEIQFSKYSLRLTGEVNNLLDQQYEVVQCYPMPGTNVKLKFNLIL
ncbi:TonB-dependent receptor [Marinifilum sp.]|uniref:TonB-dependent receptor n=1 Tax=Marinifilum sp. TaxID=2033137 RepID=UPI003BA99FD0